MSKYFISEATLKEFSEKCDILCQSKLILADKKISNILKTIAGSEDFCKLIKHCLEDFNYKIEFLKSRKPDGIKKDKYVLSLPSGETLIAYVFCLLCEFENKEKDLTEFLIEYYGFNELFHDGYKSFCESVIVPFKNTVLELCSGESALIPVIEEKKEDIAVDKEKYIRINKIYQEFCRNIDKEGQMSSETRKDYKAVAAAFMQALSECNTVYINALLSALKIMCLQYRFLTAKIRQIENVLNNAANV
jgi:hypothetical protein